MKPEDYLQLAEQCLQDDWATGYQKQTMQAAWQQCALLAEIRDAIKQNANPWPEIARQELKTITKRSRRG